MALRQVTLTPDIREDRTAVVVHVDALADAAGDVPAEGAALSSLSPAITAPSADLTSYLLVGRSYAPDPSLGGVLRASLVYQALRTRTAPGGFPSDWDLLSVGSAGHNPRRGDYQTYQFEIPGSYDMAGVKAAVPPIDPDASGLFAGVLGQVRLDIGAGRAGRHRLRVPYEPPSWGRVLETNPGRGVLEGDVSLHEVEAKFDIEGEMIRGTRTVTDQDPPLLFRTKVVGGEGLRMAKTTFLQVHVVTTTTWVNTILGLVGTVNASASEKFGGASAGTLRCAGVHFRRTMTADALNEYRVLVQYNADQWEDTLYQEFEYKLIELPVYDSDGETDSGNVQATEVWVPTEDDPIEATMYESTSWTALEAAISL